MFRRMKLAAVKMRAIPAPMLYDSAPQTGGAVDVPCPSEPWQLAQLAVYTPLPLAVSRVSPAHGWGAGLPGGPTATPRERNARYATTSRIAGSSGSSGLPFMLRRKQSLMRYSMVSTILLRGRYCG